ncbi:fimbria/pilus outer membrane usher protein [Sphingomonas sp. S1-29]|uniref:fimbria/pilus outer membrane usher protein n=1 Tax=Sphingomonas sp. S1-29 TaxID=2991074 RepID=UPI00223FC315|nr:fimbria/pilus outer membrane usher protein [Sphingomonas sp. S1-29]UZK69058.1 fimbria/pilus outer membrane usher protein [Sphingomonas sp. S1-29]
MAGFWSVSGAGAAAVTTAVLPTGETIVASQLELFGVTLNGIDQGEPLWVLRNAAGEIFLPQSAFEAWRLNPATAATVQFEGGVYRAINEVPGVTVEVKAGDQTLHLTVAATSFDAARIGLSANDPGPMTASGFGGFLNYELVGQIADGRTDANGLFELGIFSASGTGSTTVIGRAEGRPNFVRLESNWTIDDPENRRSLRFGDSISHGGVGASPLRFGGFQLATNFSTQPGFVSMALPTMSGSAALPSIVDVYVNDLLQTSRAISPGPFEFTSMPVIAGSGDIRLVVRDALGRNTVITQSYYAAPHLLGQGVHDYSYELGLLREGFAVESNHYGSAMLSGTHRYGATDTTTLQAHVEATQRVQAGSVGVDLLWPGIGVFSAAAAASRSNAATGGLLAIGFERRTPFMSLGATGEITTSGYAPIGAIADRSHAGANARLFVSAPTGFGSVAASLLARRRSGLPDVAFLNASASVRLANLGSLNLSGRQSLTAPRDIAVQAFLTIPLGQRTSASAAIQLAQGDMGATANLQRNLPAGNGIGYQLSATTGAFDRFSGALMLQSDIGNLDGEVTWSDRRTGVRLSLSGSIAAVDGQVFASRKIRQSFAAVHVGKYPGVRVYADNQLIGRTNRAGVVIVPRLRPFEPNRLSINVEDLPLDAIVAGGEQQIRPFDRSGVTVRFAATESRGGMLRIVLDDGAPLPAGTPIRLNGAAEEFVSAAGGDLYLTGLQLSNIAVADLGEAQCSFAFRFAASTEAIPQLGQFTCSAAAS